nr:MFS transporter [Amycolatopsis methanolica]
MLLEVPRNLALQRFGAPLWIARIMITWGVISGLHALLWNAESLYVARALLGAAEAGFFPGVIFFLTQCFPAGHRGKILGGFTAGIPIALVIGTPLSGPAAEPGRVAGPARLAVDVHHRGTARGRARHRGAVPAAAAHHGREVPDRGGEDVAVGDDGAGAAGAGGGRAGQAQPVEVVAEPQGPGVRAVLLLPDQPQRRGEHVPAADPQAVRDERHVDDVRRGGAVRVRAGRDAPDRTVGGPAGPSQRRVVPGARGVGGWADS